MSTQERRCFPNLPDDHPLKTAEMTRENAAQWFGNPFASDIELHCADGRVFFLHKCFVTDSSDLLKSLLDDTEGLPGYTVKASDKICSRRLEPIFRWMYTQQKDAINASNCISMIREAKYLQMHTDFLDMLRQTFVAAWKTTRCMDLLESLPEQAADFSSQEFLQLLDDCVLPPEAHVRLLFNWSRCNKISGEELAQLRQHTREAAPLCGLALLEEICDQSPEDFDNLFSASALVERNRKLNKEEGRFKVSCRNCKKHFETKKQADADPCWLIVSLHGNDTFVSKKGNTICANCKRRVFDSAPTCVKRVKQVHSWEVT